MASQSGLYEPLKIGDMTLVHRVVLAPLTRFRASDSHVPLPMSITYYEQRASVPGTFLITEGTFISERAGGWANGPAIYSPEQIEAWHQVTDAVHAKGSYIFCQLWTSGNTPTADDLKSMTHERMQEMVVDYVQAARNAMDAGFDGVEIHAAQGWFLDRWIQDVSNFRTDEYGGSIENRSRFPLEVTRAIVDAIGADKVGFRITPFSTWQGMGMADPIPQFTHLIKALAALDLAFLHIVEARVAGDSDVDANSRSSHQKRQDLDWAVSAWGSNGRRPVVISGGYLPDSAMKAVDQWRQRGHEVAIAFGRHFLANPDLPFRAANGIPLNPYRRATFYTAKQAAGYIDYPFSEEFKNAYKQ